MNGRKSKALRKIVYGDEPHRKTRRWGVRKAAKHSGIVGDPKRHAYQLLKKKVRGIRITVMESLIRRQA